MTRKGDGFWFLPANFLTSPAVMEMDGEERGQYITLLCHQWLDSNCTVSPDPKELARLVPRKVPHGPFKAISPTVLAKFPLVVVQVNLAEPPGNSRELPEIEGSSPELKSISVQRRRNDRLYREWRNYQQELLDTSKVEGSANSEQKAKISGAGNTITNVDDIILQSSTVKPQQLKQYPAGDFKKVSSLWWAYFGKQLSRSKRNMEEYAEVTAVFGEEKVLEHLKLWAAANQWVKENPNGGNRLYVFLRDLEPLIEGERIRQEQQSVVKSQADKEREFHARVEEIGKRKAEEYRLKAEAETAEVMKELKRREEKKGILIGG